MADGTIVFDTKIDKTNAVKDLKDLVSTSKAQLKDLEKEIKNTQGYSDQLRKDLEKSPKDSKLTSRLEKNEQQLKTLRTEWDNLTKTVEGAEGDLANAQNGTISDTPKSSDSGTGQEEELSALDKLKKKVKDAGDAIKNFFSSGKKTDSMSKSLAKSIFSLGNMFKMMAIRQAIRAAISAVKEGFSNLVNYSDQVKYSVNSLKAAASSMSNGFAAAIAPLLNAVAPIMTSIINVFTDAANAVARFFAMITGAKTFVVAKKQAASLADSVSDVASSAQQAEGALAGIDEINDISASSSSSGGSSGTDYGSMFDTLDTGADSEIAKKAKALINEIVEQINAIKEAWTEAWDFNGNGTAIVNDIKVILEDCYDTIMECAKATTDWAKNLNLVPLVSGIRDVFDSLTPFIQTINDILSYLYREIMLPIAKWAVESVLPSLLEVVSGALQVINALVQSMAPVFQSLYEVVIKPIADVLGSVITVALQTIANILTVVAQWISDNQPIMEVLWSILVAIGTTLAGYYAYQSIIMGVVDAFNAVKTAGELFSGVLTIIEANPIIAFITAVIAVLVLMVTHWDEVKEVASNVWAGIQEIYEGAPDWFKDICDGIGSAFSTLVDLFDSLIHGDWTQAMNDLTSLFQGFDDFLTGIFNTDFTQSCGVWGNLINGFFQIVSVGWNTVKGVFNGIITFLTGVFTGNWSQAWQGVKQVFSSIVSGFANIFKTPINWIIDGINTFIRGINRIKIPSWVPAVGGASFNISTIPRLATGTVVPPNAGEFMAILGDNKRETEVVSPLSTMKQAVAEAMAENGGSTRTDELLETLIAVVQNKHLLVSDVGKAAADYANAEYRRTGDPIFEGV